MRIELVILIAGLASLAACIEDQSSVAEAEGFGCCAEVVESTVEIEEPAPLSDADYALQDRLRAEPPEDIVEMTRAAWSAQGCFRQEFGAEREAFDDNAGRFVAARMGVDPAQYERLRYSFKSYLSDGYRSLDAEGQIVDGEINGSDGKLLEPCLPG